MNWDQRGGADELMTSCDLTRLQRQNVDSEQDNDDDGGDIHGNR